MIVHVLHVYVYVCCYIYMYIHRTCSSCSTQATCVKINAPLVYLGVLHLYTSPPAFTNSAFQGLSKFCFQFLWRALKSPMLPPSLFFFFLLSLPHSLSLSLPPSPHLTHAGMELLPGHVCWNSENALGWSCCNEWYASASY